MYYLCRDQNRHIYYMNMRSLKYFSFGVIGMVLASCVEEKNLYNPDEGTPEDTQLGLSTDFLLKTQRSVFITAVDGDGKSQAGVKFGVFMSQPYTGEGVISIDPVFVGYTDASGKLKAEVVIGNNVSKIYVAPLTAGYGQVKEADVQDFVSLEFQGVSFPHMAVSRAFSIEIPSFSGPISGLYQLYIPYKNVEISRDGIPLQGGCSLVSKEQLSPALINQIDSWYPERQNVQKAEQMKYRLADAMKQCMAKMPIERITVRQIVELSGTTRQTFYRHFQDKYDLINWYFDKILLESFEHMGEGRTVYESLVNKFEYIQMEQLFFRAAFKNDQQNCLRDHDFELIQEFYTKQIESRTGRKISTELQFELEMYCLGSVYMTVQWVLGYRKCTPEELAHALTESMPVRLREVFQKLGLI